jgi:lipoprotein signal peptidase
MKHLAALILDFLRPSIPKLFFLVEWLLLMLYTLVWGDISLQGALAGSILPLAFFYLVGSTLSDLSRHEQHIARGARLHLLAIILASIDQLIKIAVNLGIPYQGSLPIIQGWFHIANERNLHGSWLLATLDLDIISTAMLIVFILPFLLGILVGYGYYTTRHRKSVWADVAYLGLFSGLLSALCDLILRGYTLDFLQIPGIVSADLKDMFITLAIASFFVEVYTNPNVSLLRWQGWRQEITAHRQLIADVFSYTRQEVARHRAAFMNRWNERFHS